MSETIRVIQYGLGPIGCAVARLAEKREGLELVGGVDIDPAGWRRKSYCVFDEIYQYLLDTFKIKLYDDIAGIFINKIQFLLNGQRT